MRVYNKALTQAQIQTDMATGAAPDTKNPTVTTVAPANGATNATIDTAPKVNFSEAMDPTSINSTTFELRDSGGTLVPASISYDPIKAQATLTPSAALAYGTSYTVRVKSGATGVKDMSGRSLTADFVSTFSMEPIPPPIAVVTNSSNPFTTYLGEILRSEGLSFATFDVAQLSPAVLNYFDVVVLGETSLSSAQVTALTNWTNNGGNLIAMRPDKQSRRFSASRTPRQHSQTRTSR